MIGAILTTSRSRASSLPRSLGDKDIVWRQFEYEGALLRVVRRMQFDVILIDTTQTSSTGRSFLRWRTCNTAYAASVIMLTSFSSSEARELAVDLPVDDIMIAPFHPDEVSVRCMRALNRRMPALRSTSHAFGPYRLSRASGEVWLGDESIALTAREFELAWVLFANRSVLMSRQRLEDAAWGQSGDAPGRPLEQYIYTLRKKLKLTGEHGVRLRAHYSLGYKLELCSEEALSEE